MSYSVQIIFKVHNRVNLKILTVNPYIFILHLLFYHYKIIYILWFIVWITITLVFIYYGMLQIMLFFNKYISGDVKDFVNTVCTHIVRKKIIRILFCFIGTISYSSSLLNPLWDRDLHLFNSEFLFPNNCVFPHFIEKLCLIISRLKEIQELTFTLGISYAPKAFCQFS